ncbi:MAG: ATP-dependent DNA ligase [Candidatus Babeliales bacterium]
MNFSTVAYYFDAINNTSSRTEITQLLATLFKAANAQEIEIICNASLGLLRPPYRGTQFNVAEKSMIGIVAQLLGISPEEVKTRANDLGDLGSVVAQGYAAQTASELSVVDVYAALSEIEDISGSGSTELKAHKIVSLLQQLSPASGQYVVRIILGTLRLGFSDMTIVDALSWMLVESKALRARIEHAYNLCADIGFIARELKSGGIEALDKLSIKIGIPIRPAAAERLPNAQAIIDKIGDCVAQPKLDGFRLQIHMDATHSEQPEIHFFSRNLLDMSAMFPDLVEALKKLPVKQLICEGEAIVFDPNTGHFLPFQETVKRKRKHGIDQAISEFPLQFYVFDLLYADGKEYLSVGHEERRKALLALFAQSKTATIQVIAERHVHTAAELEEYFFENINAGLEGLVVKKPNSIYEPGKRNFNWIKLKRHEEGHLEDTIDCVILGYYAGAGKRSQFGIGAFLVGIFNPHEDCFQTIAKIGTGLKDAEWIDLKKQCDAHAVHEKPRNVVCAPALYPDVWTAPEIVCSILADEITRSPLHTAGKTTEQLGYALRFPRILGYREDKSAHEVTTVHEIKRLYEDQFVPSIHSSAPKA